jgi:hypothetical protein
MAAVAVYQASKLKHAEVLRDRLLGNAAMFDQCAHGQFASHGQALKDRASRLVSKRFEDAVGGPIHFAFRGRNLTPFGYSAVSVVHQLALTFHTVAQRWPTRGSI